MKSVSLAAVFAISILVASCASLVAPKVGTGAEALRQGAYHLDDQHAALTFKVGHMGFSDYVGRFESFDASLDFDPENVAAARVEAMIDMTSLDVANDEFAQTLKGPAWFDAAAFPSARFVSTGIEQSGDNTGVMRGALTLHGVTHPIELAVTFNGGGRDILRGGYIVGFSATGPISRKAFGVDRFAALVSDQVIIEIEAEFVRK